MKNLVKTALAVLVAVGATVIAPADTFARGGGGRGGGGGGRGGGGGGRGGGAGRGGTKGPGTKGGNKGSTAGGMKGKKPSDYLDTLQREDAEAQRPDFLFDARYESLLLAGEDERDAALRAEREKASAQRRKSTESGSHPL